MISRLNGGVLWTSERFGVGPGIHLFARLGDMKRNGKWIASASAAGASIALIVMTASGAAAGTMQTSPELRQAAMTNCTTDVLRLCPTVMFDEQQIFACMRAKRAQLSPNCRSVFDEGAKTVHR